MRVNVELDCLTETHPVPTTSRRVPKLLEAYPYGDTEDREMQKIDESDAAETLQCASSWLPCEWRLLEKDSIVLLLRELVKHYAVSDLFQPLCGTPIHQAKNALEPRDALSHQ